MPTRAAMFNTLVPILLVLVLSPLVRTLTCNHGHTGGTKNLFAPLSPKQCDPTTDSATQCWGGMFTIFPLPPFYALSCLPKNEAMHCGTHVRNNLTYVALKAKQIFDVNFDSNHVTLKTCCCQGDACNDWNVFQGCVGLTNQNADQGDATARPITTRELARDPRAFHITPDTFDDGDNDSENNNDGDNNIKRQRGNKNDVKNIRINDFDGQDESRSGAADYQKESSVLIITICFILVTKLMR